MKYSPAFPFRIWFLAMASLLLILLIISYVLFQARFLIAGPQVFLTEEPGTQHTNRVITLEGTTRNITHLWLNDRQIFTDKDGHFQEALVLENGYTVTTIKARDRFGRETRVERSFVFTPASLVVN